ncbi:hypothetical protein [Kribbella sp. NPDC051718]|uniref:hypothetical protein n=1 Tax=Kribbella sp. NPDC051718 TaxID=3155168 RepID=UPI003436D086
MESSNAPAALSPWRAFWRWMAGSYAETMDRERVVRIATRLPFLLCTAILLAVICRQGASLFGVGTVFILYIAAATLWISGQHQASIKAAQSGKSADKPWTFPYLISAPHARTC